MKGNITLTAIGSAITAAIVVFTIMGGASIAIFLMLLIAFSALACLYVSASGKFSLTRFFDLPVYITVLVLINFGIAPLQALFDPSKLNPDLHDDKGLLVTALLLVIVGMIAFWVACLWLGRNKQRTAIQIVDLASRSRITAIAVVLYAIGVGCKTALLKAHMYHYTTSFEVYYNDLGYAQTLIFFSQLATIAVVMLAIEHYTSKNRRYTGWLFWSVFGSECVWGLISGMKSVLLINLLVIAVVSSIIRGKLAKRWIIAAGLGLVLIYPLYNSYREVLRGKGGQQVTDFSSAADAWSRAAREAFSDSGSSWAEKGSDSTVSRLDLLQYYSLILSYGDRATDLHGEERLWMIPVYPFVPRIIWTSKPALEEGTRFSEMLGWGDRTSTAVPYIADCYIYVGMAGVVFGMFLLGIAVQRYTNRINGRVSKYDVVKYTILLISCFNMESGVFFLWTTVLKTLALLFAVRLLAYYRWNLSGVRSSQPQPVLARQIS